MNGARGTGDRIESLLGELEASSGPRAAECLREAVRHLMAMYGEGLARLLAIVDEEEDEVANRLFGRFVDDALIASLMVVHGLHPLDTETRVRQALERVRPYLGQHGGDVHLVAVDQGVAHLRLDGSCHGCPSSAVTMRLAVERAILEAAPEITRLEVEGLADPPPVSPSPRDRLAAIPAAGPSASTTAQPPDGLVCPTMPDLLGQKAP